MLFKKEKGIRSLRCRMILFCQNNREKMIQHYPAFPEENKGGPFPSLKYPAYAATKFLSSFVRARTWTAMNLISLSMFR